MRRPTASILRALALVAITATGVGAFYEWGGAAYRGMQELKERKHREAAQAFREARKDHPRSAAVRYDEALALQGAGSADSAASLYEETYHDPDLEGDPARAAAAYNRGNMAMKDRRFDEARTHYMESLRLDPSRADAKKNLEEAIRRLREAPPTPSGSGGGSGGGPPPPGGGEGQQQPPPPGGEEPPPPGEQPPQGGQSRPDMGGPTPSQSEAEHWLDALEAERKAARQRERESTPEESRSRDW